MISELRKGKPRQPAVKAWWAGVDHAQVFLSVLTLGEIRKGIETLRRRDATQAALLERWLAEVTEAFGPRLLAVDAAVAEVWGRLSARRSLPVTDSLLAATAIVHDLVLVTRNTRHVADLGARLLNPFDA